MDAYSFHVSFDWDATPDDGKFPLELGLAGFPPGRAPFRDDNGKMTYVIKERDTISFQGFNKTSGATLAGYSTRKGENPSISFTKASDAPETQTASSPLNHEMEFSESQANTLGSSDVFEPNLVPMWDPLAQAQPADVPGRYHFTVSLYVVGPNGGDPRLFEHDPEMIVQGTPPVPPPHQEPPPESSAAKR